CPAHIRKHCIERRGDGVCNLECSFIGCGFDGGDCNNGTEAIIL
nr:glp-1 protein LNG motif {LNG3} [Caenorhabditis elegans, Peptide Partial, 43 aa] [Caenorhabditis elegans]